jgi:hypothetical protein
MMKSQGAVEALSGGIGRASVHGDKGERIIAAGGLGGRALRGGFLTRPSRI